MIEAESSFGLTDKEVVDEMVTAIMVRAAVYRILLMNL